MHFKRYTFLFFTLYALLGLMACSDDASDAPFELSAPQVSVQTTVSTSFDTLAYGTNKTVEVEPLDRVTFDVTITAEGGFSHYAIYLSEGGALADTLIEVAGDDLDVTGEMTYVEDRRSFELPNELVNTTATFTFLAFDQLEQSGQTTIDLEVRSPKARRYTTKLVAATPDQLTVDCFFNSSTGTALSAQKVLETEKLAERIDFGYYYGLEDSACIASPRAFEKTDFLVQVEGWSALNATIIRSTNLESLDGIERFEDIDLVYEEGEDESGLVTRLNEQQVVAFETVRGRRGLIRIKAIMSEEEESLPEENYIELEVVVQERSPR